MAWAVSGDRPGVRHGHRDPVQADGQPHAEVLDQPEHRGGHPLPLHVGLRAVQQQEDLTLLVHHPVELQVQVGVGLPLVGVEHHRRPPAAVVVQLVVVEGREHLVVELSSRWAENSRPACPASTKPSSWWISTGRCSLSLAGTSSFKVYSWRGSNMRPIYPRPPAGLCSSSRARARSSAVRTRFSDTGTCVRRLWANRLTRSSSIIQPTSSTKSGSGPGGAAAASSAYASSQPQDRGQPGGVPGGVGPQADDPLLRRPQVARQLGQVLVRGGGQEAREDQVVQLLGQVGRGGRTDRPRPRAARPGPPRRR